MQIISAKPYLRTDARTWNINAQVVDDKGMQKRIRFNTGFKMNEDEELNKLLEEFLKQNAALLTRLFFKNTLKDNEVKLKKRFSNFKKHKSFMFKSVMQSFINETSHGLKNQSKRSLIERMRPAAEFFSLYNVKDIDKVAIEKFFDMLDKKDIGAGTKKHYAKALNRVLKYALEADIIVKNPFKLRVWKERKEIDCFNESEIKQLLTFAKGEIGLYLKIALLCGARTGEILALQWKHIDFMNSKIHIEQNMSDDGISTCKTENSHRIIDLLPTLKSALEEARQGKKEEDFIFKGALKPFIKDIHKSYLKTQYISTLNALGIAYRPIYNTRHSFASLMLSKGENIMWVSWMLGHKSTQITLNFYSKYLPSEQKRASFLQDWDEEKREFGKVRKVSK